MREGKDIVAVSIPFQQGGGVGGMAAVRAVPPETAAALTCLAAAGLAALYCRKGERNLTCLAMFFCAGLLCGFTAPRRHSPGKGASRAASEGTGRADRRHRPLWLPDTGRADRS